MRKNPRRCGNSGHRRGPTPTRITVHFLAAGLVNEFSVVLAAVLDGARDAERIVATDDGLQGMVTLSLVDCERLAAGALHLRYAVQRPTDAT